MEKSNFRPLCGSKTPERILIELNWIEYISEYYGKNSPVYNKYRSTAES